MARKEICHEGVVVEVLPDGVIVEMVGQSACAGCHAKGVCSASDEQVKRIAVPPQPFVLYEPGDKVVVELQKTMGLKAVWISYVIPLAVLMVLILVLSEAGLPELYIGAGSLAAVGLYYLVIYLLRDRIARQFCFTIRKID